MTRVRTVFGIQPGLEESVGVATKWTELDALLLLEAAVVFVLGATGHLDGAVLRVVDVDVGSRSWHQVFDLLVARPGVAAVECGVYGLLLDYLLLNVVLFLGDFVCARARVLEVRLLRVRRLAFVSPELASFGFGQETRWILTQVLAVGVLI